MTDIGRFRDRKQRAENIQVKRDIYGKAKDVRLYICGERSEKREGWLMLVIMNDTGKS